MALVSTSGTPTATNLSFLPIGALGTSKIGFLDGANVSEGRKYDLLTFCEIIFGDPTGGPNGGLRSQVSGSGLRSKVSGLRSQVSGLRSQFSGLRSQVSGLKSQVSGLRSRVSGLRSQVSGLKVFIGGPALAGLNSSINIHIYIYIYIYLY